MEDLKLMQPRNPRAILVTGAAGFIGSHLARLLLQRYPECPIVLLDQLTYAGNLENLTDVARLANYHFHQGDIRDVERVSSLFGRYPIDIVIHLAAESHVDRAIETPTLFAQTNIMGTLNLLECARAAWGEEGLTRGQLFYQISTDEVYGALGQEGIFTESTPYAPRSPYSASKASADLLVHAYGETYRMPVAISCCSNNYGPYQFPEKLIPLCINNILHSKPIPLYGDGSNVRDWLYVKDHARAIDTIAHWALPGARYNIGGNNELSNKTLVTTLCDIADGLLKHPQGTSRKLITRVADRKGHDFRYAIDSSRLKQHLGWTPQTTLEEGLLRTVEWYLNHQDWLQRVTSGEYLTYYSRMYGKRR